MKDIAQKIIIYDNHCPLCNWYTEEFINHGLLSQNGRVPFEQLTDELTKQLDMQRSRHEIPLIDLKDGKTLYGLDSLIYLLSQRFRFIHKLMSQNPIYYFFKGVYAIISYNRRIISGADKCDDQCNCEPDFNLKFRLLFVLLGFIIASYVSVLFGETLATFLPSDYQFMAGIRMLLITSTGWLLSAGVSYFFLEERTWMDYLGHLATIMLIGVLLFIPWMLFSKILAGVYPITLLVGMLVSLVFMGIQHAKRVKVLQISQKWSLLWAISISGGAIAWAWYFFG